VSEGQNQSDLLDIALGQGVHRAVDVGCEPVDQLVAVALIGVAADVCGAVENCPAGQPRKQGQLAG
jgi:hypothetical protein